MEALNREFKIDLRVRGIMNSKRMFLSEGRSLGDWKDSLGKSNTPSDLEKFVDHVQADHLPHAAIIDCTSSAELRLTNTRRWLDRGIHIITPNKKGEHRPDGFLPRAPGNRAGAQSPLSLRDNRRRRACPSSTRCANSCTLATKCARSKAFFPARCRICSTPSTARRRFPRS